VEICDNDDNHVTCLDFVCPLLLLLLLRCLLARLVCIVANYGKRRRWPRPSAANHALKMMH